jgi:preprotein translocase subunit SecY
MRCAEEQHVEKSMGKEDLQLRQGHDPEYGVFERLVFLALLMGMCILFAFFWRAFFNEKLIMQQ